MTARPRKIIRKESTGRRIIEQGRVRLLCVGLFFFLCFSSIAVQMVEVAVLSNPKALTFQTADSETTDDKEVEMLKNNETNIRGDIVDRNGVLVATSLITASAYIDPKMIKDKEDAAQKISVALKQDKAALLKRLNSSSRFVWIKRSMPPAEQQVINSMGIPGLYFLPDEKRVYPQGNMLAHVLGYVGVDNKGLAGIERTFDERLRDSTMNHEPVKLSIDTRLQAMLHDEMSATMNEFHAIGAMGAILDIKSGELLAMSSLPDFDPQNAAKATDAQKFNRASQGAYEMGSTFKTFTSAMALDSGTVTMKSGYDASHPFKIATFTISDAHSKGRWLTVPEIFAYSSNIGTAKMALDCGTKRQKAFMEKLGMTKPIEIELSEKSTPLYPKDWKEINTVTISYGHGISVSPLHLLRGIAAVTNGGLLPTLTLIKNQGKPSGERIISEDTSRNIRRLLRLVVEHGTGSKADVLGYRVGGKTGTAEKINSGGVYNADAKIASFISVFPVDDPKYAVLVMMDEPKGDKSTYGFATGGWISAPVVGRLIQRMGPLLGIMPKYNVAEDDAEKFWTEPDAKPKAAMVPAVEKRYVQSAH